MYISSINFGVTFQEKDFYILGELFHPGKSHFYKNKTHLVLS